LLALLGAHHILHVSRIRVKRRKYCSVHYLGSTLGIINATDAIVIIIIIIIIIIINYYVTNSKCGLCQQFDETIDQIISACPMLAKEQYQKRHDKSVCTSTLQHIQANRGTIGQKILI